MTLIYLGHLHVVLYDVLYLFVYVVLYFVFKKNIKQKHKHKTSQFGETILFLLRYKISKNMFAIKHAHNIWRG